MPKKFVPKADPIDAEQFDGTVARAKEISSWVKRKSPNEHVHTSIREGVETYNFLGDEPVQSVEHNVLSIFMDRTSLSLRVNDWLALTKSGDWKVITPIMMNHKYDEVKESN